MIKRIIAFFFLTDLFIALGVYLVWYANGTEVHTISLGSPFLAFMKNCSEELNSFKIEIPDIPTLDKLSPLENTGEWYVVVLNVLLWFVNTFFGLLNALIYVFNIFIRVINVIIQLLQFIFILLKNLIIFKDVIASS